MSQYPPPFPPQGNYPGASMRERVAGYPVERSTVVAFFNVVYAWKAAGLALTAVVAWWVSTRPDLMQQIFRGPTLIVLIVVELALVWIISAAVNKLNAAAATALFMLHSAIN